MLQSKNEQTRGGGRTHARSKRARYRNARGGAFVETLLLVSLIGMAGITAIRALGNRTAENMCRPIKGLTAGDQLLEVHWWSDQKCCAVDYGFGLNCI